MKTRYRLGEIWTPGQIKELTSLLEGFVPMKRKERATLHHYATAAVLYESSPFHIDCAIEDEMFNNYLDTLKCTIKKQYCPLNDCDGMSRLEDHTVSEFIECVCAMSRDPSTFSEWSVAFNILNVEFGEVHSIRNTLAHCVETYTVPFECEVEYTEQLVKLSIHRLSVDVIVNSK